MSDDLYRIKPLAWERANDDWFSAHTVFGTMNVRRDEDGSCQWDYCFDEYYDEDRHACDSIEAGKVAAEAYYRQRLLPALDAHPNAVVTGVQAGR